MTRPSLTVPVDQPSRYARSGYYPTHVTVEFDVPNAEYRIVLNGLVYREAGRKY
jgi:hypothetical protein